MYFPYLRGKQFELIALREMSDIMAEKAGKISPIIEPVKLSSTLRNTVKVFKDFDVNFNIVVNPSVGELKNSTSAILEFIETNLADYRNFQIGVLVDEKTRVSELLDMIADLEVNFLGITLVHRAVTDVSELIDSRRDLSFLYNVIYQSKTSRRYYRQFNKATLVSLDDFFNSQSKNADYLLVEDSSFSEEHLYFDDDGYIGFSDFLTIGDNYSEGGFLPYAIAIHITYEDSEGRFRVKHFVSDSNDDSSDIGGKFSEANEKLVAWVDENDIFETRALIQFQEMHDTGHFPGLGSVKKLSIMHHIELVLNLI